ncbi:ArsR family transcriptional regulator [Mycetocola manganoxydans]|uniref:ArsR family transcriptional regulator n=1 Tax=Mycetocola manganoxydans TaxID=699879 RepID=A0A3L6ZX41_9MICO|nr:metalloregulator ArsR/SmtB family transcription factor [Mycetocola manganoxydans]RLP72061.1 ArsR family transcriptional regulator [Mycetocola manganoxydans]GHD47762.1 transcriptional regulator [Mycetocola manganoxydans]
MEQSQLPVAELKAELFKALGHPVRIQVLEQLVSGERSVGSIAEALNSEVSNLSQQLAVLRRAGVVSTRREGNTIFYALRHPAMSSILTTARQMILDGLRDRADLLAGLDDSASRRA